MTAAFDDFLKAPTHKAKGHKLYRTQWFFALRIMPESAYGEMLLGSLHRRLGLAVASEKEVAGFGTLFAKNLLAKRTKPADAHLQPLTFRSVLQETLDYPRTSSQSGKRRLTILPIVPELANYTAPVRLRGNPWNPGQLIADTIVAGSADRTKADQLWNRLFQALRVTPEEDVWAQFLAQEVKQWRTKDLTKKLESNEVAVRGLPLEESYNAHLAFDQELPLPARQFVRDLSSLIGLKDRLTRRAWLAYLESLLRLGAVTHTQWLCRVHDVVWRIISQALTDGTAVGTGVARDLLLKSLSEPWWTLGNSYAASSRTLAQGYQRARYGLNLVLFELERSDPKLIERLPLPGTVEQTAQLVSVLATWAASFSGAMGIRERLAELLEADPSVSACRKGFTNNLREFWKYGLAKRQPQLARDSEFDQGFWLQKRGTHRSAPWTAVPGPVALSFAAHACSKATGGFATIGDLREHFARYGLGVLQSDFESGPLADRLRGLGLVVDSPDAESGMGVLDPLGSGNL